MGALTGSLRESTVISVVYIFPSYCCFLIAHCTEVSDAAAAHAAERDAAATASLLRSNKDYVFMSTIKGREKLKYPVSHFKKVDAQPNGNCLLNAVSIALGGSNLSAEEVLTYRENCIRNYLRFLFKDKVDLPLRSITHSVVQHGCKELFIESLQNSIVPSLRAIAQSTEKSKTAYDELVSYKDVRSHLCDKFMHPSSFRDRFASSLLSLKGINNLFLLRFLSVMTARYVLDGVNVRVFEIIGEFYVEMGPYENLYPDSTQPPLSVLYGNEHFDALIPVHRVDLEQSVAVAPLSPPPLSAPPLSGSSDPLRSTYPVSLFDVLPTPGHDNNCLFEALIASGSLDMTVEELKIQTVENIFSRFPGINGVYTLSYLAETLLMNTGMKAFEIDCLRQSICEPIARACSLTTIDSSWNGHPFSQEELRTHLERSYFNPEDMIDRYYISSHRFKFIILTCYLAVKMLVQPDLLFVID